MYRDSTVRAMETVRPTMNKILIVDDSATMRKMLRRLLEAAELEVGDLLEAGTGLEALRAVVAEPGLCAVLCDVLMPEMDGLEFLKLVRRRRSPAQLPVIMVTTEGNEVAVRAAEADGANGYLHKPLTPDELRRVLEPYVEGAAGD